MRINELGWEVSEALRRLGASSPEASPVQPEGIGGSTPVSRSRRSGPASPYAVVQVQRRSAGLLRFVALIVLQTLAAVNL